MEPVSAETASLEEIWTRVFDQVRREVPVATVWLAMQAVRPLVIDGSYFVTTMAPDMQYLALNLQGHEASVAIEEALQQVTGRVLAFRLLEGQTLEDWQHEKLRSGAVIDKPTIAPESPATSAAPESPAASAAPEPRPAAAKPDREVYATWEKLNEHLVHGLKTAPFAKYPQGQARYILASVQMISDTMDLQMPKPGQPRDESQERTLAKTLERLGSVVNLDPLFLAIELLRLRELDGKAFGE